MPVTLSPTPFKPSFSAEQLADLQATLAHSKLPKATFQSLDPANGITHPWMESTLAYWQNGFDWKKREEHINSVDHFKVPIVDDDGRIYSVHYVGHFSSDPAAIPLLLLHGWPGSFLEFIETIKILRTSTDPSFHLIAPSQPGYGFSDDPPLDRPWGMYDSARLSDKLMRGLGFESGYAVQGGDIGSVIARIMSTKYDSCKAININYLPLLAPPASDVPADALTERERRNADKALEFIKSGRGYGVMQGTRPGTIGMVIQSSPIALLAWLGEKFRDWTDEDPSLDVVLETVTMWWILGSYPKAIYAYAELVTGAGAWHRDPSLHLTKPFGYSSFGKEIASAPEVWAKQTGNLQFYRYHEQGGHFAALERPAAFAEDMRDCFRSIFPR